MIMANTQNPGMDPWVIQPRERAKYQEQFDSLRPINGIITGEQAKGLLLRSQLPPVVLGQIWSLSDTDADGKMDINEFCIACKLITLKLRGFEIPKTLPSSLIQSLKAASTGNLAAGLTNGAATIPTQNNITSLVNLTGTGTVPVQPLVGVIPVSTPPARPLIGPPSNGTIGRPSTPASPMTLPASRQNRQNVASNIHATTHTPSKPPARPAPPSVGIVPSTSTPSTGPPQRPTPPSSIGSNFPTATNVPPPKPAPPSFPNSPVAAMSPAKALPTAATAIVPPIQPMQSMTTSAIGAPAVAPIAPLNTNPTPIAAFGMGQTMPMQPLCTGMVAPMTGGSTIMSSIPPLATGTGVVSTPPVVGLPLVSSTTSGVPPVNGTTVHSPVSTCTPLSTTARPPSIDRVGSVDSQHSQHSVGSPQSVEWAVPHQTKLKYTQLFNTWDRTRSGFLSGPQARNIMVQSELPQPILARIWALADMDSDGRLGCDEFVLAMHLCDLAKGGEQIPNTLPLELIPPIFRRQRQGSLTQSQGSVESIDPSAGMPQTSFEDKRKENFEKGQAELERRRKALLEIQRKEQEERERKEREEAEKQEKIRLEQERRRQAEIEKQMLRQKEIEQEKEEQRKRAHEQREAARKEMERQRHLEWEKQKSQELQAQRQKEQDVLLKLKAKNQTLTIELGTLNDKVKELSQKICDTRVGVSSVKTTIDGMRFTRDSQLQEMTALKNKLREQNQRLLSLSQEKARIEAKNKLNSTQDTVGQEAIKMAFDNKQITLKQMKDKIADMQQQIDAKMTDIENNNGQLEDIKTQMKNLIADCKKLYITFEDKKTKVLELRVSNGTGAATDYTASAWGDDSWGDTETIVRDNDWPVNDTAIITNTTEKPNAEVMKYRALYEFVARNQDEISFQPGDIILVPPVQNAEPGWMAGEIRGHTGWFPESYVEPIDSSATTDSTFMQQDSVEKRILEGIAEVPENVSDAGSLGGEAPTVEAIVPTLGLGVACNIQATALYQYRPTTEQHLSFDKGDTITVIEQQNDWWYGELSNRTKGWFPKSYVKETTINDKDIVASVDDGLNEYYIALYQYASAETGDLSFNQNEVILVIKKEGDWWTGCIGDRTGIFPSNYVEKCDAPIQGVPLSTNATEQNTAVVTNTTENQEDTTLTTTQTPSQLEKTAEQLEDERAAAEDRAELPDFTAMATQQYHKRGRKPEIVQVIAPYQATSAEQLDLQRGQLIMIRKKTDSGWWEGELQARGKKRQVGWFPASYVKPLTSSSNRSTPVSHGYQDSPTDPNVERVMALYPYQAQNEDELTFEKGDVITMIAKDEETWWKGELNGVSGLFPSNYVSSMSSKLTTELLMARLDPMERKRQEYIKELITTEQAYIEDMRLVHEVFEKPLIESLVLTLDEVDKIFVNWRDIIACNDNFLRTLRIRRENSEGGIVRMIGDILCENIPRMSAYIRFCSCQISAAAYLQRLTETLPEFVAVAHACQQDPRTKGMPLSSFLIKPMQRITKYPLIINKILEHTPPDHPDRQYLQEALARAEEFCTQVNEGVREKENSDRLEWLQNHIVSDGLEEQLVFNSLTNSLGPRKLLHYGILHKAKSGKELVSFLTNDFLLFAQPTKSLPSGQQFSFERNKHQRFKMYRKPIFLNELSLLSDLDTSGSGSINGLDVLDNTSKTLRLKDSKKPIILIAPSTSECSLWKKRITEARRTFMENEKTRLQRQRSKQAQFGACGRILVTVFEGSNLKAPSGKCNTFCKVSMGSQEERTSVVSETDCPLWDTSMQFLVKDLHEDTLCITVFDKGYYSPDEFLGRAEIRVADIMRDSKNVRGPILQRFKLREVEKGDVILKLDLRLFNSKYSNR
ncbi:PREDICTED: intersectin-1 isoform X1 [Polistes canadensis]|uniref:intersectin-1 isoform X1 n=1 Tax=Polistes canadensis TaxID=91411 RepID=UPI000718ED69|nr:PREDICTED: intersectin-1 isoform X1 [Polistes canadensis]XP_014616745.1 PREDICTED: intersectin-1 isoform X1 [Polistes canadensis]